MADLTLNKKAVVGLGNPGEKFKNNRHNFGAMVIYEIARRHQLDFTVANKLYKWSSFQLNGETLCLLSIPLTYMNNSGIAVKAFLNDFLLSPNQLLVIVDDLDLPLGKIRLRAKGSDGGHKGLKSIIAELGTSEFARLRLGIGPQGENEPAEEFVLSDFRPEDKELLQKVIQLAADCALDWATDSFNRVMSKYNPINLAETINAIS